MYVNFYALFLNIRMFYRLHRTINMYVCYRVDMVNNAHVHVHVNGMRQSTF